MVRNTVVGVSWPVSIKNAWPFAAQCFGHLANRAHRTRISRISRIFWNESAMCLHLRNIQPLGEIRSALQRVHALPPRRFRHQPNGGRPIAEIPYQSPRAHHLHRGRRYLRFPLAHPAAVRPALC